MTVCECVCINESNVIEVEVGGRSVSVREAIELANYSVPIARLV